MLPVSEGILTRVPVSQYNVAHSCGLIVNHEMAAMYVSFARKLLLKIKVCLWLKKDKCAPYQSFHGGVKQL